MEDNSQFDSSAVRDRNPDQTQGKIEGKRMQSLRNVMDKTVKSFTNQIRLVKTISNASPAVLNQMQEETKKQLEENIQCELDMMYEEENVANLLNGLDRLTDTNTHTEDSTWHPSGNVDSDTRTHVATLKRQQLEVFQKTLGDMEAQNKLLQEQAKKREKHLLHTRDKIINLVDTLEQTVQVEKSTVDELISSIHRLEETKTT